MCIKKLDQPTGAGLKMWRDFFPNAQIYGIDYNHKTMVDDERIQTFQMNSKYVLDVKNFIERVGGDFDLIVDDGSHRTTSQIQTANNFLPYLKDTGIYVTEDVSHPHELGDAIDGKYKKASVNGLLIITK